MLLDHLDGHPELLPRASSLSRRVAEKHLPNGALALLRSLLPGGGILNSNKFSLKLIYWNIGFHRFALADQAILSLV